MPNSERKETLGRPFWTLFASSGLSNLADGVFKIALPLVAIHFTRSPALVAGLELVRTLPWLVGALHVGALTDRFDRRNSMLWANSTRAVFVAVAAAAIAADQGSIWLLYAAAIGTGVAEVFYDTSAQSILPALVPRPRLDRANGRLFAVELGAQEFIGPPLGGVLIAVALALGFGASTALWVLAMVALLLVRGNFQPEQREQKSTLGSDIREGLRFLIDQAMLKRLAVMVGVGNLAGSAAFAVLVLYAVGTGSALGLTEPQYGLLIATVAAGAVLGALLAERVQTLVGRARALTLTVVGMVLNVSIPALTTNATLIAVVFFVGGFTIMVWNTITVSLRQRITPDHLLGRVNSAYRLLAWGTRPLGAALGGVLGELLGLRSVFVLMGVVAATALIPNRAITDETLAAAEKGAS